MQGSAADLAFLLKRGLLVPRQETQKLRYAGANEPVRRIEMRRRVQMRATMAALTVTVWLIGGMAMQAQGGLRNPNPEERVLLMHYRDVINKVLDQFQSDDWNESVDYEITDDVQVSGDPDVPLDVNELTQRSYNVRNGSTLYEKEVAPIIAKLTATTDPMEMAQIARQKKVTTLKVEVHFNRLCVGMDAAPKASQDLHLAGPSFATHLRPDDPRQGASVVLLFGNWKVANWNGGNSCLRFKFKHAAHQPAIENVVIQLDGSPERIDELLHSVNWQPVNEALTEKVQGP
jgi:hypothetical protein